MKEQILHLDPHDDFQSARDKIGWAQTARVLLVWPPQVQVLARRLDLLLLQRHASRLGAHLALIATHPVVRENAQSLGLPVFPSLEASRRKPWRSRRPLIDRTRPKLDRATLRGPANAARLRHKLRPRAASPLRLFLRLLLFVFGLSALASLVYALAPSATITLRPVITPLSITAPVIANPQTTQILGNLIPARWVRAEVEAAGLTATTGQKRVPTAAATGNVVFTNLTGQVLIIPQGTGLRTTSGSPVRFQTTTKVVLEPRLGATVMVSIKAVDLGPVGNVTGGQINAVDGPLGLSAAVTNPEPTTGGAESLKAAVTNADRARLRAQLSTQLQADALTALQSQLQTDEFLATDSVTLTAKLVETYDFAAGEQADTVRLTLRLAYTALAVSEADGRTVAQAMLANQVPNDQALLPGREVFSRPPDAVTINGQVYFTMQATSQVVPLVDITQLRDLAKGQPLPTAQLRVANALPLAQLPSITVWPTWLNQLPLLPFKIQVVVE